MPSLRVRIVFDNRTRDSIRDQEAREHLRSRSSLTSSLERSPAKTARRDSFISYARQSFPPVRLIRSRVSPWRSVKSPGFFNNAHCAPANLRAYSSRRSFLIWRHRSHLASSRAFCSQFGITHQTQHGTVAHLCSFQHS